MYLETERITLRKIQESDFADFCEYAMDDEMSRMMGRAYLHSQEEARLTFDWLKDREERCYVLVYKESGKVIGNLNVCRVQRELQGLEILRGKQGRTLSFCISRHYQRRGLMEEVLRAVIDCLFDAENMDFIQCGNFSFNTASEQLQKKLGFEYLTTQYFDEDGEMITVVENVLWRKAAQ